VAPFTEQRWIEDMPGAMEEGKSDVVVEINKNNKKKIPNICEAPRPQGGASG
jgi:hypothetical protein